MCPAVKAASAIETMTGWRIEILSARRIGAFRHTGS
jgi:hypothetical protein